MRTTPEIDRKEKKALLNHREKRKMNFWENKY